MSSILETETKAWFLVHGGISFPLKKQSLYPSLNSPFVKVVPLHTWTRALLLKKSTAQHEVGTVSCDVVI